MYLGNYYKASNEDDLVDEILDEIEVEMSDDEEEQYFAGQLDIKSRRMEKIINDTYQQTSDIKKVVKRMNELIKKTYNLPDLVHLFTGNLIIVGLPVLQNENIYDLKRKSDMVQIVLDEMFATTMAPKIIYPDQV